LKFCSRLYVIGFMKILFFNYEYPPLGAGAGNATKYILKEYAKEGDLEVDLITSSLDENYHEEKIGNNVILHKLPIGKKSQNINFQSQKDLLIYTWKAFFFARKLLREKKYDLSHAFFTVPCGFLAWLLKKQYGLPYVISLRGSDVPGYNKRFSGLYVFLKPLIKNIWKNAAAVVANSFGLKTLALETNSKQEIAIIENGINTEAFFPDAERRPKDKIILTSGASRITTRKGLNYLLGALAELIPVYPNLHYRILGEGDEKNNLENLTRELGLAKNVEFLGNVLHEKTPVFYQEASFFVLPSLNEGMSNAMLEALASGLPILTTDTGGARELVKDGENGFILKMEDSADIVEKIKKLLTDPALQEKMAQRNRAIALEKSWKKVAEAYKNIYQKIEK
jgi:L-malate glycosyltransferase